MKKKVCEVLAFILCILPITCGFIVKHIQAGFWVGQILAKRLAEYMESL